MTFPSRRKPLTLIFCCSVAGTFAASLAGEAQAQSTAPFRVDPGLLGLPPAKPAQADVQTPFERAAAESRPVDLPPVETRPLPPPVVRTEPAARRASEEAVATPAPPQAEKPAAVPKAVASQAARPAPAVTPPAPSVQEVATPAAPAPVAAPLRSSRSEVPAPVARPSPVRDTVEPAVASGRVLPAPTSPQPAPAPAQPPEVPVVAASAARSPDEPPLRLRRAEGMLPPPLDSAQPRPVFLSAQTISGVIEREVLAEQEAELRKVGTEVTADRLTYWPVEDEVEADGNVRMQQGDDIISGPKARLKLEDQVGFFDQASYFVKRQAKPAKAADEETSTTGFAAPKDIAIKPGQTRIKASQKPADQLTEARGEAERIDLQGENQIHLTAATYTTCKPGSDDWYLSAGELQLDYDNDVGSGKDATVRFFDVPILHSPWLSFPLNNERKSGFLAPSYGSGSSSGFTVGVPYYWNIAPNMDATFEPQLLTKRGWLLGGEFQYLDEAYGGKYRGGIELEYLPHDRQTNDDRWAVALRHRQTTANGFTGLLSYNRVSDNDYYTDLSSKITNTSRTQLLQQGSLTYGGGGWWSVTTNLQSFQTLQPDPENPVTKPYRLLPQITVNARQPDLWLTDSSFFGQYTSFVHPDANMVEGQRTVLQPQISLPFVTPGWYVTPRVGVNLTHYSLSYPNAGVVGPDSITRTLPIFSIDSGMTFDRSSNWFGRDYTQTLEPRLFYLNIPYKNQNDIPIFDTALADFNFAQIFADNQFSGWDRINNANQLTAALSSRLIDPASGAEIMRAMVGQRVYFSDDKVILPGTTLRRWDTSDFLAAFSGQVWPKVYLDAALQYDPGDQQFERYALSSRYTPEPGKALSATYSYNIDAAIPIKQIDLAGQWPIGGRWQAVGRYNYSFLQSTPIEIIGGLEYNAGCWAVRTVAHRLQTTEADSTTRFFVQLELNGLSSIGSNPLSLLQRRIPGYAVGSAMSDQGLAEW